jgi:ATP-dependent helicase/nuclease subunit A
VKRARVSEAQLGLFDAPVTPGAQRAGAAKEDAAAAPETAREQAPPRLHDGTDGAPTEVRSPGPTEAPTHSARSSDLTLPDALRLDRNLALMAGAGTGKTHNLITLCLHLLGGAREAEAVAPQQLGLLTFTDKAAAEMRQRLYKRVDALAHGGRDEPDLFASYEKLGRPVPPPAFWRGIRDALGGAPIGTFHSLCVQLLREAPPGRAVTPSFELLEGQPAEDLLDDLAERVIIAAIERGDPQVCELVRRWNLSREWGAASNLTAAFTRMREEGETPQSIALGDPEAAYADFEAALARCRPALQSFEQDIARSHRVDWQERVDTCRRALEGFTLETAPERLALAAQAVKGQKFTKLREVVLRLRESVESLRVLPFEDAFRALLGELQTEHQAALRRRNALDFAALLIECRDLLRDDLDFRCSAQGRFKALLVDELQDTNRVQLELLHLLAEQREGAPRQTNPPLIGAPHSVTQLPLEPAFLCVVGDRKQSIYEFRGADVAVVEQAAKAIDASGGGRAFLKTSRRASPKLVDFFNRVMPKLMSDPRTQALVPVQPEQGQELPAAPPPSRPFEVSYVGAHDDLLAHRAQEREAPAVERFVNAPELNADELRQLEARALARRVRELIDEGLRGRDIVLLFRRFTFVEEYRQALIAEGVPHRLVRGRGFYGAQEVLDLGALLTLTVDPSDAMALATVLRSPLCGLSDASLLRVAGASGGRLDARAALALAEAPPGLSAFEAQRFAALQALVRELQAERHLRPVRSLLQLALERSGYLEAMAATPFGGQILANVEKLLELSLKADDCGVFARRLQTLSEADPLEANAEIVDEDDPHAVTLCTIHQAKGLEWPVVIVPELFAPLRAPAKRVRYERDMGLAMKLDPGSDAPMSTRFLKARDERSARELADFKRLRYVALTRARDLLIFGAATKKGAWADLDDAVSGAPGVLERPLVLPEPKPPLSALRSAVDGEALEAAAKRLAQRPAPKPRSAMLPVTQLQDFALCPRRYRFAHLLGVPEPRAGAPVLVERDRDDDVPLLDIRERGTAAHKLLEKVVLGGPVEAQLVDIERAEGLPDDPEVRIWVRRFFETAFARAMQNVRRELPFVLRLTDGEFALHLRGQIDLLVLNADGSATVVDYKTSLRPEDGLDAYRFQLGCYTLAARALLGNVPLRAGIAFLRENDPSPQLLPPGASVDEAWLAGKAHALVTAQIRGDWQGLPEARCRAIHCGYLSRCYPHSARL